MKIEIKQLVIAGVIIAMVLGFVLLQYLPMSNTIKKLSQEKIDHSRLGEQADADQQKIPILQVNIAKLEQKVGNIENKIPNESDYGTFLQSITEIMKKNKLSEQIVKPDKETVVGNLRCIPITMEGRGIRSRYSNSSGILKIARGNLSLSSYNFKMKNTAEK